MHFISLVVFVELSDFQLWENTDLFPSTYPSSWRMHNGMPFGPM